MNPAFIIDFINRNEELSYLTGILLRRDTPSPAIIVIRSPSGFGKSRLTDQLKERCESEIPAIRFCVVEPELLGSDISQRIHEGFFLQRCAEQLSRLSETDGARWPSLAEFLRARRWKTIKSKNKEDLISELPSLESAYKIVLDYVYRALHLGDYSPEQLLRGDSREAVAISTEYTESVLGSVRVALVIRQAQKFDVHSLRTILGWSQELPNLDIIIEYSSDDSMFHPDHYKIIMRTGSSKGNLWILDLVRLESHHLEDLIRSCVSSNFRMTAEMYSAWNGNLNSVLEMQFQAGVRHRRVEALQIQDALSDLPKALSHHASELSSLEKIIMATCLAHVESIQGDVLVQAIRSLSPATSSQQARKALNDLSVTHNFLSFRDGGYSVRDEIVADSVQRLPSFVAMLAAAEVALRNIYYSIVLDADWAPTGASTAMRQLFRLCARTKDAIGLLRAIDALSDEISRTHDQSMYAEIVAAAVKKDASLFGDDLDRLLHWASGIAYDVANYRVADELLGMLKAPDEVSEIMQACALQEIGKHDHSREIAGRLQVSGKSRNIRLAARLLDAMILGCLGDHSRARSMLDDALSDPECTDSMMLAYAHRFHEVIEDTDNCLEHLHSSIAMFDLHGMNISKAYSQASAAVLLARTGRIEEARTTIAESGRVLNERICERQLLLNNMAAIELLSPSPDYRRCADFLTQALRHVRDDYSEATVLSNLSIAHMGSGNKDGALRCIDPIRSIIDDHDFASRELFLPLCLNAAYVLEKSGNIEDASSFLDLPNALSISASKNKSYWDYRYRRTSVVEESWRYLVEREFHPLYLSHWLIDLEGLNRMRQELPQ
jgi:hypothetical protein